MSGIDRISYVKDMVEYEEFIWHADGVLVQQLLVISSNPLFRAASNEQKDEMFSSLFFESALTTQQINILRYYYEAWGLYDEQVNDDYTPTYN